MAAKYKAEVRQTSRGYTLRVTRDGEVCRRVTKIATREEALRRARWWRKEFGARIREVTA
jgi:hypothetical protein